MVVKAGHTESVKVAGGGHKETGTVAETIYEDGCMNEQGDEIYDRRLGQQLMHDNDQQIPPFNTFEEEKDR
jgi:hypothetical protein